LISGCGAKMSELKKKKKMEERRKMNAKIFQIASNWAGTLCTLLTYSLALSLDRCAPSAVASLCDHRLDSGQNTVGALSHSVHSGDKPKMDLSLSERERRTKHTVSVERITEQ